MRHWYHWRRGVPRLLIAGGLALVAGGLTAAAVARADDLAATYGNRRSVPIAVRDLAVGAELEAGDVSFEDRPDALVGGSPVAQPVGRTVVAPILTGEAIVAERLAPDGLRGPMALAPSGTRALAIPVDDHRPPVAVGDHVDVLALALDGGSRAQRVAASSTVVAVSDDAVTVAVEADEVAATARAALEATAVIALVGDG